MDEMAKYYEGVASMGLPGNIESTVHKLFSKIEIEYTDDNKVIVRVPRSEGKSIDKFREDAKRTLLALEKENSALAKKLARYHGFKLDSTQLCLDGKKIAESTAKTINEIRKENDLEPIEGGEVRLKKRD